MRSFRSSADKKPPRIMFRGESISSHNASFFAFSGSQSITNNKKEKVTQCIVETIRIITNRLPPIIPPSVNIAVTIDPTTHLTILESDSALFRSIFSDKTFSMV
ncbi:hypothetical protein CCP2SC5_990004 [Azospirillaceae bacterium]